MATTARDTTTRSTATSGGSVKRGTSPSSNSKTTLSSSRTPNSTLKKTLSTATSASSDRKVKTPQPQPQSAPASSSKSVPNYLKSTAASRHESYVPRKTDHDHKPQPHSNQSALERRRSFDKPPSASRIAKAITSPAGAPLKLPARSSSFSPRTSCSTVSGTNTQRPFSKTPLVKSTQGFSLGKSLKKSATTKTKKISTREVQDKPNVEKVETDQDSEDHSTIKSGGDVLSIATSDDLNYDVHDDKTTTDHESVGECSEYTIDREGDQVEIENVSHPDDQGSVVNDIDQELKNDVESEHDVHEQEQEKEILGDNNNEEANNESEETSKDNEVVTLEEHDNIINDNNEEQEKEKDEDEAKENVNEEVITEMPVEEVQAPPPVVVSREEEGTTMGGGASSSGKNQGTKKESPVAYNDVIEETKNKLLEKSRKNKVLALVGAFETVIDYETAANSPSNKP
ncbi:hypothetical protein ACFE04_009157 [Oxalis oulophora]